MFCYVIVALHIIFLSGLLIRIPFPIISLIPPTFFINICCTANMNLCHWLTMFILICSCARDKDFALQFSLIYIIFIYFCQFVLFFYSLSYIISCDCIPVSFIICMFPAFPGEDITYILFFICICILVFCEICLHSN